MKSVFAWFASRAFLVPVLFLTQAFALADLSSGQQEPIPHDFDSQVATLERQLVQLKKSGTLKEVEATSRNLVSLMEKHLPSQSWQLKTEHARLRSIEGVLKFAPMLQEKVIKARDRYYAGEAFEIESNYEKALDFYSDANALYNETVGEQDLLALESLVRVSRMQAAVGKTDEAIANARASVEGVRRILGPSNPLFAKHVESAVSIERHARNYQKAEGLLKEAIEGMKESSNQEHTTYGQLLIEQARLFNRTGRFAQAKAPAMQATSLFALNQHSERESLVDSQLELAQAYCGSGEHRECVEVSSRVGVFLQRNRDISPDGEIMLLWLAALRDSFRQLNRLDDAKGTDVLIKQLEIEREKSK